MEKSADISQRISSTMSMTIKSQIYSSPTTCSMPMQNPRQEASSECYANNANEEINSLVKQQLENMDSSQLKNIIDAQLQSM